MIKKTAVPLLIVGCVVIGVLGYAYVGGSFYSKHEAAFSDVKEMQYNSETFMAVFYEPSCDLCQKAEQVFEEFSEKHDAKAVTVNVKEMDENVRDPLMEENMSVPVFYYFIDGQLAMRIDGYHPLDVYEQGLEEIKSTWERQSDEREE